MIKVPNTVSDQQMEKLRKRAAKLNESLFTKEAVERRKNFTKQRYKAELS